jgi:hypothetical protein
MDSSSKTMAPVNKPAPPLPLPTGVFHDASRYAIIHIRFLFLVSGMMVFFGLHNYLQELIMSLPGFKIGVFLGYLEVLGVAVCSFIERRVVGETVRRSPLSSYSLLCFCLLISSATSNIALAYINYPTKVVFRSCKLIPTMVIAVLYNKKKVHGFEFFFGAMISLGMIFFAVADFAVYVPPSTRRPVPPSWRCSHPVSLPVCCPSSGTPSTISWASCWCASAWSPTRSCPTSRCTLVCPGSRPNRSLPSP